MASNASSTFVRSPARAIIRNSTTPPWPRASKAQHFEYVHLRALGGLRRARKDYPNTGWRNEGFRGFANYMQTDEFQDALAALTRMCAEAVPWRCHRSLVADALSVRGVPVVEILSESSYRMHKPTLFAQVEGVRITYPSEQATLLYCCKPRQSARRCRAAHGPPPHQRCTHGLRDPRHVGIADLERDCGTDMTPP
jgi:Protein of unknown function, DUF488